MDAVPIIIVAVGALHESAVSMSRHGAISFAGKLSTFVIALI